ncbi:hypothetical protein D1631_17295 [Chryseobacterium nematophagum]|uniref:Uncharacterized protein n=1 Tax=Chryseobacterium nematophagum TaxID=2305228 RepID=A0A3M7TIZ6_9FLAO|nr:hypothetical protein [Chryseobacterium nematophagum]RNA63542.1 hypothetical protein D1631_17295 [Chryseobacterium nematophagum]
MDFFILKRAFILNYKKLFIISGTIRNDLNKPMSEFSVLLINNSQISIEEVQEVLIENNSYIAFTFKLDGVDESLLEDIIKSREGREFKII